MPAVQYPFIDIAVHERVRDHFGRGEAMALFSMDLQTALWANGRGAALFGTPMIYDFIEHGPRQQDVTFRQFSATAARLSRTGDSGQFTIRIHSGFKSVSVIATAEIIEVEPGQPAILFTAPIDTVTPSLAERARRMIEGFDDPDIHMAVLDADSKVLAASPGFDKLGITPVTTRTLVSMASGQRGKLVKRPVPAGKGYLPAAAGQLSQDPELNLLFVVETVIGTLDPSSEFTQTKAEPVPQQRVQNDEPVISVEEASDNSAQFVAERPEVEALAEDSFEPETSEIVGDAVGEEDAAEELFPTADDQAVEGATEFAQIKQDVPAFPAADEEADVTPLAAAPAEDREEEPVETVAALSSEEAAFSFDPNRRASRFVWKIDAAGRFSSISHEFAEAVGPNAADVEGMSFADLAALFNLDPEGKIIELLNRRDTWSGKTIHWPVEGTSLTVPIDLAALPTYTRSREFDGFRGFGIVRIGDAVEDPNAVGLTLAGTSLSEEPPTADVVEQVLVDEDTLFSLPHADEETDAPTIGRPQAVNENVAEEGVRFTPPEQEVPVLKITETPNRRYSDKIVQFEDRRAKSREPLTANEQAAFQEIARTLKPVQDESDALDDVRDIEALEVPDVAPSAPEPMHDDDHGMEAVPEASPVVSTEQEAASVSPLIEDEDDFADYTRGDEPVSFIAPQPASRFTEIETPAIETHVPQRPVALSGETVDQMPVALLIHSGDRLIHANPEFLRLTGYGSIDELAEVGGLDALLQRDELDAVSERSGGMIAVTAENDLIPVKARLQSIRWEDAAALMLSLIPTDEPGSNPVPANENAQVQTSLDETEVSSLKGQVEELHSILETATDGVVLLAEDGTIRSLNRSASALFNYDNNEISAKPFVTLFAHESQRAVLDYLSGLANNGVASVLNDGREVIGREASGGFLPLFMTIGRLKSSNGYCAVIRDITQWKRTEEDLRNAKRVAETANAHKTDFLARVSHEIRTPLNAIIGFADMMATERFGPVGHPRYIEYSNDIVRSGRHVLDIVNDLLDISKIEAGQMDVDFKAVALNDTIAEAVSIVQPQANNQRVIIRTALSQSVPQIVADLRSIKQIMLNILSNAIKFTPSGGQIVVSTAYEANGSVILRIRDTGIGMTRSELEQAMKPFRQVSASSNRVRGDGTGLGLPLTKAMVDANRANFSITSAPNEGTLVEISFPSQRVLAN
ncbi:ATP-binding protein [Rhizobium sp. Leaf262]|uniref:ATP-binding protein n=1 Tax=Rhizobium sp. Leaf262 TaxID=1736312 RepID=UPI0007135695|nr:ATP-binding protein [Rhizobium sp. Leaf262]KQO78909.1 PAS domain-containing sensor histidine kinase [Rhizobium sp. Leaf262]